MLSELLKIVADNCEVDEVTLESDLREDLEMNSMDIINMTIDIEAKFKIRTKEKDFKNINTVADLKAYIEKLAKIEIV
ncbi:MAG: hypothetical protein IJC41_02040 [Firmicutes bacterium]|nr:hypothetical protein [Bacillota bacterium]MBR6700420.1 hypothetical protein [Bacillota bacterium]